MWKSRTTKKREKTPLQKAVARLDRVFSLYIRLRDMIPKQKACRCISCGRIVPTTRIDCGHYINRQHMALRFSEMNCHAQCHDCNRFDEGNNSAYRNALVKMYGENAVVVLEAQKYATRKWTVPEIEIAIDYYKKEIKKLEEEKGELL